MLKGDIYNEGTTRAYSTWHPSPMECISLASWVIIWHLLTCVEFNVVVLAWYYRITSPSSYPTPRSMGVAKCQNKTYPSRIESHYFSLSMLVWQWQVILHLNLMASSNVQWSIYWHTRGGALEPKGTNSNDGALEQLSVARGSISSIGFKKDTVQCGHYESRGIEEDGVIR